MRNKLILASLLFVVLFSGLVFAPDTIDITPHFLTISRSAEYDNGIWVGYTIKNPSNLPTEVTSELYLDGDLVKKYTKTIPASSTYSINFNDIFLDIDENKDSSNIYIDDGRHSFILLVDSDNKIDETNEENNRIEKIYTISMDEITEVDLSGCVEGVVDYLSCLENEEWTCVDNSWKCVDELLEDNNEDNTNTCSETDNGKDYYEYGEITNRFGTFIDGCSSNGLTCESEGRICITNGKWNGDGLKFVDERYCLDNGNGQSISYECEYGCKDGACLKESGETERRVDTDGGETGRCVDTDGGENYNVKGTVTAYHSDGIVGPTDDYCDGDIVLRELYCAGTTVVNDLYECPNGCKDGVCISSLDESVEVVLDVGCPLECDCTGEVVVCSITMENVIKATPVGEPCDSGCGIGEKCFPYGIRLVLEDIPAYCGVQNHWEPQQSVDDICQNNYECTTNFCSNGKCFDIEGELKETKGVLQQIVDFLTNMFGNIFGSTDLE